MAVVKNRVLRLVLFVLGWLFLGIAFVGVVLPGIPTTGPVLLAGFLFSKSSERFDEWLVNNRYFGPIVQDWRARRGFTRRAKTIAIVAIAISFGVTTTFFIHAMWARASLWLLAAVIASYILTRPTKSLEARLAQPDVANA